MSVLNKITIKSRMILSFTVIVILFVIFGTVTMNEMGVLGDLTATLYNHPLPVSNAAINASMGVIKMHRSMKDVAMSQMELEVDLAIQTVQSEEQKVYEELDIVKELIVGEEGKKLAQETIEMFAGWKPIRLEVMQLVLQGDRKAAVRITQGKGADYVARLERKMNELASYARIKADGYIQNAEGVEGRILRNTIVFILGVILLSICIGYFMTSSILSSVSSLRGTMSKITATGELTRAELIGNNEITEMSQHFNGLIERLKSLFWLREGQNALNNELSAELTYDEILTRSLNFVARYVNACAGALYSYNEKNSVCELKSSFAFVERKYLSHAFAPGEGIVGQVAVEKKPILLKNITSQEAVGQTGTVSEPPKGIYAIPLIYENKLYGVLEIASFEAIDEMKREFLDSAAATITIALYTSSQNEQIKGFLESSQEANEKLQVQTKELQDQSQELQALNEELKQQSEEVKKQNAALEVQRRQVEEANRLKSEFLSNMSHELRTPLNSVMALSRVLILQAEAKLSTEETNYLAIIERNGKQLLALINDILDLSKIESGKMDISIKAFSIGSTIAMISESLEPVAEEKGIAIIRSTPEDLPRIESDESRVHQILQNIIGNAVKFTNQGSVTVSASSDAEKLYINVQDTGIGISDQDLPHIFDEFRQVDGSSSRRFEGTGLGLTIAYRAAKMLGGDISMESVYGKGTTFTVTLPIQWEGRAEVYEPLTLKPPARAISAGRKTVLIVDDDPNAIAMISEYLAGEGYEPITATSGKEALNMAETQRPFAITLDVIMPEMDGWEVLQHLKENPATAEIPVIIVSVSDDRETGVALGAVGSITKPCARNALMAEIHKIRRPGSHSIVVKEKIASKDSRILLVEDNESARIQVKSALESEGFSVDVVRDGEKALDYVKHTIPDGIILDLMMPGVDGFDVLENIRSTPATVGIPVLILTAKDLTKEDLHRLTTDNIQQLIQKGDVDREGLVFKAKSMMGLVSEEPTRDSSPNPLLLAGEGGSCSPSLRKRGDRGVSSERTSLTSSKLNSTVQEKKGTSVILIVEDNPDNLITIKAVLQNRYEILEAANGEAGLQTALAELPDLILLDMSLPKMDGFEVAEKIKADERARQIPVIALTARAMKGDREKILDAGCDDYISKPVDPEVILKKLDGWMGKR